MLQCMQFQQHVPLIKDALAAMSCQLSTAQKLLLMRACLKYLYKLEGHLPPDTALPATQDQ
jgi:hypothetical protein